MTLILLHILVTVYAFFEAYEGAQRLRLNVLKTLVFGGIGLIHGFIPIVTVPWHARTNDAYEVHVEAAAYTLIGTLLLGFGFRTYQSFSPLRVTTPTFEYIKHPLIQKRLESLMILSIILGLLAWYGTVYASGSSIIGMMTAKRYALRGEGNGVFSAVCSNLMVIAFIPGFIAPFMKGKFRHLGMTFAICFAIFLFIVTRGTRAGAIGMLGSLIGGMLFANRISAGRLFIATAALGLVGVLAIGLLPLRHRMSRMSTSEMVAFMITPESYQDALTNDPLNYHDHFVGVVTQFPDQYAYVDGAAYRRVAFFYLPSSRFPTLKPKDPNRVVAEALFGKRAIEIDWMHPPSIFGDCYINFRGWYGIGWMFIEGIILAWISRRLTDSPWWLIGFGPQAMYLTLIGMRGQPYTITLATMFAMTTAWFLLNAVGIPRRLPPSAFQDKKQVRAHINPSQRIAA